MRFPAALLVFVLVIAGLIGSPGRVEADEGPASTVRFSLDATPGNAIAPGTHRVTLHCDGRSDAIGRLSAPRRLTDRVERPARGPADCVVEVTGPARKGLVTETMVEVEAVGSGTVVHRATGYDRDRIAARTFRLPAGDVEIRLRSSLLRADRVGTQLSVMAFNILHGGRLDEQHGHGFEQQNVAELLDFIRSEDPDVLFSVETYGTGDRITEALNRDRADGKVFTGVPITRRPGQEPDTDNLWLFTHLPVQEVYPAVQGEHTSSFHFGGARLGLPGGRHLHAFSMWLSQTGNAWSPTTQAAIENRLGLDRSQTREQLEATDAAARVAMAEEIVSEHLPSLVRDDAPVIIAGDANAMSPLDWAPAFADAPGHEGLTLDWPALSIFDDAGFVDSYRHVNPDAGRHPGRTFSAGLAYTYAPARIDYILTRGDDVRVLASSTRDRRLPEHRGTPLDAIYPFYSDHGAVVSELLIRGSGRAPVEDFEVDAPFQPDVWPDEPPGTPIPADELTATASTESPTGPAAAAVDGDLRTLWHSDYATTPPDPLPHTLTVDLGSVRDLTALRYLPRINGFNGIVTDYTLEASTDGSTFTPVADGEWPRTQIPRNVDLAGVQARYLRLTVQHGVGLFSSAAEVQVYERP